jgi:HAD superfamily hydrolase (TIGR01509 family)
MLKKVTFLSISLITLAALAVGSLSPKKPTSTQTPAQTIQTTTTLAQAITIAPAVVIPTAPGQKCAKNIIFDLNGVLFGIKKGRAASHLGIGNMISYLMAGHSSDDLEQQMFDVLYKLDKEAGITNNDVVAPEHNGKPLPNIMRAWLRGTMTSEQILAKLMPFIEKLDTQNYFAKSIEKTVITKLATIFFDAEIRTKLYAPIKKCVKLLKQCKAQGHKVYLLSNIDVALIDLLKVKYPQVFEQFDGIVLSAEIGLIKPDTNIFGYTLRKFNLKAEETVLLDDSPENKAGALKAGITAIQYDCKKHKVAQNELKECGVVLPTKKNRKTTAKVA